MSFHQVSMAGQPKAQYGAFSCWTVGCLGHALTRTVERAAHSAANALPLAALCLLLMAPAAAAEKRPSLPAALSPWVDWVLDGEDQRGCAIGAIGAAGAGERVCAWPGQLWLELDDAGGRFEQSWTLAAEQWVPLPGGSGQWPQQVSANGAAVAVVERDGRPMLRLVAGESTISGRFVWPRRPDLLQVPAEVGLLSLRLKGAEIDRPRLDATGGLWLGADRRPQPRAEPDALSLEVARRIQDSVPLRVQTRLLLEVSGQPRELLLGPMLLPGGLPLRLDSPLPARLIDAEAQTAESTPDGASDQRSDPGSRLLQLQLRPGRWELTLESRHPGPVDALSLPQQSASGASDWPRQEVWVFAARPELRQVELSGAEPIDPRQTRLPADWQQLPAYLMHAGETLRLEQLSRGASGSDQIRLERLMRLDFDASGLSLRDRLSGRLQDRWRIQAEPPLVLGQVSVDGEPRLITRLSSGAGEEGQREGVEVRGTRLDLRADARIDTGAIGWSLELPGSGWELPLSSARTQLYLPPGWDLLAAAGVDNLPNSWLARWSLLDIFLVLVATLAVMRIWGWPWGLLALVTLVLTWQEPGAPRWVWLNLIAAAALLRLLPGSLRSGRAMHAGQASASERGPEPASGRPASGRPASGPPGAPDASRQSAQQGSPQADLSAQAADAQAQTQNAESRGALNAQVPPWLAALVRLYYRLALLSLVLITVPFLITEVRDGLFPQLEQPGPGRNGLIFGAHQGAADAVRSTAEPIAPSATNPLAAESLSRKAAAQDAGAGRAAAVRSLPTLDPDARLQTGTGVPDWSWRRFELSWSGPLTPDHRLRLWLRPASAALPLALLTLVLIPLLALRLADLLPTGRSRRPPTARASRRQVLIGLLGLALIEGLWLLPSAGLAASKPLVQEPSQSISPPSAQPVPHPAAPAAAEAAESVSRSRSVSAADRQPTADSQLSNQVMSATGYPPAALLTELRQRLLAPPDCVPRCAEIAQLVLDASPRALRLLLAVDAAEAVVLPVPGARNGWSPSLVELDGQPLDRMLGSPDGGLAVPIPSGRHLLLLSGSLAGVDQVAIPLPLRPRLVETRVDPTWQLEGVGTDGVPGDQLRLLRQQDATGLEGARGVGLAPFEDADASSRPAFDPMSGSAADDARTEWPPLLKITRTLRFGLDWELLTEIERRSPPGQSVSLRVPLIEGESVTTAGIQINDAGVLVSLPPGRERMRWRSALRPVDRLVLRASEDPRLTEEWRLQLSPIWHLSAEGVPRVQPGDEDPSALPIYRPWPGERLILSLSRPVGVAGPTLTLDRSRYQLQPGHQSSEALLQLGLRSSQGGRHRLPLPAGAEPTGLRIDGQSRPLLVQDNAVELALVPGHQQIELEWLQPGGLAFTYQPAPVTLGVAGVNAETRVRLGEDRWVLWASGPGLGPAVQFWGLLLVLVVLALILARARLTPLGAGDWLLLGIGLSQVSIWIGVLVVFWLFALGLRRRLGEGALAPWRFNLMQVALALLSMAALGALLLALQQGLLGSPTMQVAGNGSSATELIWYLDRNGAQTAPVTVVSAPIWIYRLLMLAWALWLAWRMLDWLRWGWQGLVTPTPWLRSKPQRARHQVDEQPLSVDL